MADGGAEEGAAARADPGLGDDRLGRADVVPDAPVPGAGGEGLDGPDAVVDLVGDDDVVVAEADGAGGAHVVVLEGDDDGRVGVEPVVAVLVGEAHAAEGEPVGDVVEAGGAAAEADEAARRGEHRHPLRVKWRIRSGRFNSGGENAG